MLYFRINIDSHTFPPNKIKIMLNLTTYILKTALFKRYYFKIYIQLKYKYINKIYNYGFL